MSDTLNAIIAAVKIADVYRALGGPNLKGNRAIAFWRGGKNFSVSFDSAKKAWRDHKTGEGGGVLDLVVKVRGGHKQDALHWLSNYTGIPLSQTELSHDERRRWASDRRRTELTLPAARHWRRTVVAVTEELLEAIKASVIDGRTIGEVPVRLGEIYWTERFLARLIEMEGKDLVDEFDWWKTHHPGMTGAMVRSAATREAAELRAMKKYLGLMDHPR